MSKALSTVARGKIAKTGAALVAGQVASAASQLVIPPIFIHSYGVRGYGEWLALSAGAGWLQSMDFGLQTYIINQLSLEFYAGRIGRLKQLQSVSIRVSLGILGVGTAACLLTLLAVPVTQVLHLSMTAREARIIAALLTIQTSAGILWGQLNGVLRAVGFPHRAEMWAQTQRAAGLAVTYAIIVAHGPLWAIPASLAVTYAVSALFSLGELRARVPQAFPAINFWSGEMAREVLGPSLWFGSFTVNQFLLFQAPILVLNQTAGAEAVVIFSLCRTYFGIVRQGGTVLRFAIRPEITRLAGLGRLVAVSHVFQTFEKFYYGACAVAIATAATVAPRVVPLWARAPRMYSWPLYAIMGLTTVLMLAKDARLDLQQATNTHVQSAKICLFGYISFVIAIPPLAQRWEGYGVVCAWGIVELLQLLLIAGENSKLITTLPVRSLLIFCALLFLALPVCQGAGWAIQQSSALAFLTSVSFVCLIAMVTAILAFDIPRAMSALARARTPTHHGAVT